MIHQNFLYQIFLLAIANGALASVLSTFICQIFLYANLLIIPLVKISTIISIILVGTESVFGQHGKLKITDSLPITVTQLYYSPVNYKKVRFSCFANEVFHVLLHVVMFY